MYAGLFYYDNTFSSALDAPGLGKIETVDAGECNWQTDLAADWPTADGDLPEVDTGLRISSIENTGDEVLVELPGAEAGAWLTHRRDNKAPDRLVTGLEVSLRPVRTTPLSGGWRLVRYAVHDER